MHLSNRPNIVRQQGSDSSWVRKGLGPIRLGSEKVWVRVVPEILGPSRLGSELSDIRIVYPSSVVRRRRPSFTISKIFSSKTARQIKAKFYILRKGERKFK